MKKENTQKSPHSHFFINQRTKKQVKAPENAIAHSPQPAATLKAPDTQIAAAEVRPLILSVSVCQRDFPKISPAPKTPIP